jgi:hypothetical protein
MTRAMKKLIEQQKATNLAISVLCDLSKNIVQCVNGSKNAQTIHYFSTLILPGSTLLKDNHGSSTNNQCAQSANYNLVNIYLTAKLPTPLIPFISNDIILIKKRNQLPVNSFHFRN